MKRRIAAVAALTALVTPLALALTTPAQATRVCVATSGDSSGHDGDYWCVQFGP